MSNKETRTAFRFTLVALAAWLLAGTAALAQVEQAHLRIDGMT